MTLRIRYRKTPEDDPIRKEFHTIYDHVYAVELAITELDHTDVHVLATIEKDPNGWIGGPSYRWVLRAWTPIGWSRTPTVHGIYADYYENLADAKAIVESAVERLAVVHFARKDEAIHNVRETES